MQTIENKEYYPNGQLMYADTVLYIDPSTKHLYEPTSLRTTLDGTKTWLRIGEQVRYWPNGQLNWRITYDNTGKIVNPNQPKYRADGTIIQY